MKKPRKLTAMAQSVLKTLCSNYRENMQITALFRAPRDSAKNKLQKDTEKALQQLRKLGYISSYRFVEDDSDEMDSDAYKNSFVVSVNMNLSVEEMAEISVNSQTVFMG